MNAVDPCVSSGGAIGIRIPEMAEFRSIGKCAVAIAEHHFVTVVIVPRDDEISYSILIEVCSSYVEFCSPSRQRKRPRKPERAIACAEKDCGGIGAEIRHGKVKIAIASKISDRDGYYRAEGGNLARTNHVAPAVAKELQERAVAVPHNHVGVAVSIEVADDQREGITANPVMRGQTPECTVCLAEQDGKKMLTGVYAIRQSRLNHIGNSIPIEVPRRNNNGRLVRDVDLSCSNLFREPGVHEDCAPRASVGGRGGDRGDHDDDWQMRYIVQRTIS